MPSPVNLYLFLHTRWIREGSMTHEEYRTQLSFAVADIVNKLKTGSIPFFVLDGQASILEDLAEVVPELCDEISLQVAENKLEIGPWYVQTDCMLVSGESLLRNLELGLAVASKYGKPMMLGYCSDSIGHSQDMPRILNNFDIKTALVSGCVPESLKGSLFVWQSPDGSRVLSYHLARGFDQTAFHDSLTTEKLAEFFLTWGGQSSEFNAHLVPVGGDFLSAPSNFNRQIESARLLLKIESMGVGEASKKRNMGVQSCSLSNFASLMLEHAKNNQVDVAPLSAISGAPAARINLQNRLAEKRLTRVAEPLFTILSAQKFLLYPQSQLNHAWRILLRNHSHGSVHSVLNVLDRRAFESMAIDRPSDVEHLFDALASHAQPAEKPTVAGKNANAVCNVGYKLNDADEDTDSSQKLPLSVLSLQQMPDPNFVASRLMIANLSGEQNIGPVSISWCEDATSVNAAISVFCPNRAVTVQVTATREEDCLFSGTNQLSETKKVRIFDGYVHSQKLPTFGLSTMPWNTGSAYGVNDEFCQFASDEADAGCSNGNLSNEFFSVEVDTVGDIIVTNKKLNSTPLKLRHTLRQSGNRGDSPLIAQFDSVGVGKKGPLVSSLIITYKIDTEQIFKTEVLLKKSVPILFFETSFESQSRNHGLDVVFDTGSPVDRTYSENHFSLVETDHKLDKIVADRFLCQRFFIANEQAFFNDGLPEYGVDKTSVSLTLLRSGLDNTGSYRLGYAWAPLSSSSYGEVIMVPPAGNDTAHPEAQTVLEHLAQSASARVGAGGGDNAFKSLSAQEKLPASDDCIVNAYRLCEIFEGLHWTSFTKDVPLGLKSNAAIDNPAIRVVAMRTIAASSEIEIRLLNVLPTSQAGSITVHFAHQQARLTFADGRLIKPLVANDENQHIINGDTKKKLPNDLAHVATYPVEMEANALVSLRLK